MMQRIFRRFEGAVAPDLAKLVLGDLRCPPGTIGLLKVDVEGHELAVFKGAKNELQRDRPVVIAELEQRHGTSVGAVNELLHEIGYCMFYMKNGGLMPCSRNPPISPGAATECTHAKPWKTHVNFVFVPGYV